MKPNLKKSNPIRESSKKALMIWKAKFWKATKSRLAKLPSSHSQLFKVFLYISLKINRNATLFVENADIFFL